MDTPTLAQNVTTTTTLLEDAVMDNITYGNQTSITNTFNVPIERLVPITSVLFVISTILNFVSIAAIISAPEKHTGKHILFLNLAIADTLGAFSCYLDTIYYMNFYWNHNSNVTINFVLAIVQRQLFVLFYLASALTLLVFVSLRHIAICRPTKFNIVGTSYRIRIYVVCIWITSVILSLPPYCHILEMYHPVSVHTRVLCDSWNFIWPGVLLFTFVIIMGLYISISLRLRQRSQRLRNEHQLEENCVALVTTVILMTTLILSLLPYILIRLLNYSNVHFKFVNLNFAIYIPYLNFITDPLIYGRRTKSIREGYSLIAKRLRCYVRETYQHVNGKHVSVTEETVL
ncbi:unnamed protein product [Owenia fusiformis]|uniref:Uncharacterized protein n=1 Tax=Owenia fusiformis TaxID=6347 RepID=A0A8J1TCG8_OWEFU|nr:unnamed protein product [Owenia fusiformis]